MGKYRAHPALLCVLWLLSIGSDGAGQVSPDAVPAELPPGVEIFVDAAPKIGTVGDPIRIDLDITMPAGYQVEIPQLDTHMGEFAILDFFPGPTVPGTAMPQQPAKAEPLQHHRARIVTAIYKTGKFTFPSIRMKLKTAEGKEVTISNPSVNIEIKSVLDAADQSLKDLKKQAELPEARRWILWAILALATVVFCAVAWRFWRRRRKRPIPLSPAQVKDLLELAEVDLRNLLTRGLPDGSRVKQFYVLLSEIVKRILELGYGIHTVEQTTSEIMDSLRETAALESGNVELIESFLLRCDVVKFAKYVPSEMEHKIVSKDALQILAEAKKAVISYQSPVASSGLGTGD